MDKYTVIKKIGQGTYGTALLCHRKGSVEAVVIKRVDIHELPEAERRAARREAEILSHLNHPCIIKHIESFEEDGHLCIVTEYAEKGDMSSRLEERKGLWMREENVLDYFVQMCLALHYLHKRKILHRDLKAANVFVNAHNEIKLGDFGIARVLKYTMECAKTVVGTPYYLSPEICEGKPYNHKSDVWSIGCILYEMCALKHAFEAGSITALVRRILRGRFDPIPSVYSDNLRDLVGVMLQLKPGNRPSIGQILSADWLKPYVDAFAARCMRSGRRVDFLEDLKPSSSAHTPSVSPSPPVISALPRHEDAARGRISRESSVERGSSRGSSPAAPTAKPVGSYDKPSPYGRSPSDKQPLLPRPTSASTKQSPTPTCRAVTPGAASPSGPPAMSAARPAVPGEPAVIMHTRLSHPSSQASDARLTPDKAKKLGVVEPGLVCKPPSQPVKQDKYKLSVLRDPNFHLSAAAEAVEHVVPAPPDPLTPPSDPHIGARPRSAVMRALNAAGSHNTPKRPSVVEIVKANAFLAPPATKVSIHEMLREADQLLPHGLSHEECKMEATIAAKTLSKAYQIPEEPSLAASSSDEHVPEEHAFMAMTLSHTGNKTRRQAVQLEPSDAKPPYDTGIPQEVLAYMRTDKFIHGGKTLHLPRTSGSDPLPHRLEALRIFLAGALGDDVFIKLYRSALARSSDSSDDDLAAACRDVMSARQVLLAPLLFQLLYCERLAFAN